MPSLVVHLLLPPLLLLASRRFPTWLVVGLLPLSLLPDIDFFVPPHRALFHSAFLVAGLLGLAWWLGREGRAGHRDVALVAAFYLGSHSLMDLFAGGVVPLWPLSDETFFLDVQILIDTRTLEPFPTFQPGSQPGIPQVTPVYEFLSGEHAAILALTLVTFGVLALRRARRVRYHAVVVEE